jgi:cell division septal protein FtsQ
MTEYRYMMDYERQEQEKRQRRMVLAVAAVLIFAAGILLGAVLWR